MIDDDDDDGRFYDGWWCFFITTGIPRVRVSLENEWIKYIQCWAWDKYEKINMLDIEMVHNIVVSIPISIPNIIIIIFYELNCYEDAMRLRWRCDE